MVTRHAANFYGCIVPERVHNTFQNFQHVTHGNTDTYRQVLREMVGNMDVQQLSLGHRMRLIREDHGLTRPEVARMLGCSPRKIQRLELDETVANLLEGGMFALVCGVTLPQLYPAELMGVMLRYAIAQRPLNLAEAVAALQRNGTQSGEGRGESG